MVAYGKHKSLKDYLVKARILSLKSFSRRLAGMGDTGHFIYFVETSSV